MQQVAQTPDEWYFHELICWLARIMAARRGAIWIIAGKRMKRKSQYQDAEFPFPETPSDRQRSDRLLREVAATGRWRVSHPSEESHSDEDAPNSLLLAVPVIVKQKSKTVAIIEIAHGPGAALVEFQRSHVQVLERVCDIASERIGKLVDADDLAVQQPPAVSQLLPAESIVVSREQFDRVMTVADTAAAPQTPTAVKKRWWEVWKK